MTESTPPQGSGPNLTFEQIRQLNRSLTEKVLDRAASNPDWRQLLLEDPEAAMRDANFPETRELQQQGRPRSPREREVVGQYGGYSGYWSTEGYGYHYGSTSSGPRCDWHCRFFTWRWYQSF